MTKDTILAHEVRTDSEMLLRFMEFSATLVAQFESKGYICMYVSIYIYIRVICGYICNYVNMCVYIYAHTRIHIYN